MGGQTLQKLSRPSKRDALRLVIGGLAKHFSPTTTFVVNGVPTTVSDLTKLFQSIVDALDSAQKAKADFAAKVKAAMDASASSRPVFQAVKDNVLVQLGHDLAALGDFGFKPRKRAKTTVATKDGAVKKAKATKTARHTLGPKARLKVKAQVTLPP
jgi:hypothetical protein